MYMSDMKDIKVEYDLSERILRVTAALYRVTDILTDEEPLKWSLRQGAMNVFDYFSNDGNPINSVHKNSIRHCKGVITALQNKILLAEAGGFMSHINFEVLGREYRLIRDQLTILETVPLGPALQLEDLSLSIASAPTQASLSQSAETSRSNHMQALQPAKQAPPPKQKEERPKAILSASRMRGRKQLILENLKSGQWLGLADIWQFFRGEVSEKTIQRDLNSLYLQGMLAIEGDKRWRRYMLSAKQISDGKDHG